MRKTLGNLAVTKREDDRKIEMKRDMNRDKAKKEEER